MDKRKRTATAKKVDKLLKLVSNKKKVLIVSHDNPDPDTLASALALRHLIQSKLDIQITIAYTGIVGRAENKAMIKHLNIPLRHMEEISVSEFDFTILVDSQPHAGRLDLPEAVTPDAVIDHHPIYPETRKAAFHDVQSRIGATSTIIAQYFVVAGTEPDSRIATALLYGIKSDTRDLGRETSKHDLDAYLYLYPYANLKLLSKIEYPDLPAEYFRTYDRALENALTFDGALVSFIGDTDNPDLVAEFADRLVRLEGIRCALVGGYYDDQIFISLRTRDAEINAGKLVKRVIGKLGPSGGHGSMSAGRIKMEKMSDRDKAVIEKTIIRRLKRSLKIKDRRGKKLVD